MPAADHPQRRLRSSIGAALARGGPAASWRERVLATSTALVVLLVVQFVLGLAALLGAAVATTATPFPSGFVATPVGQFLGTFLLYPWPFYVAAAVVLLVVRPVSAALPLPVVLVRGTLAGAVGTVALALVGIVPGVLLSLEGGTWANLALYLTSIPLSRGIGLTAVLLVGCVLARLWLHEPQGDDVVDRPERTSATDGAVPPPGTGADAGDAEGARARRTASTHAALDPTDVPAASPPGPGRREPRPDDHSRFAPPEDR
ncbi:hypothetical protein [Frigoribacterium salinisoli]